MREPILVQTIDGPLRMEAQRAKGMLRPWRQTHQAGSPVGGRSGRRRGAGAAAVAMRRAAPGVGQALGRYAAVCNAALAMSITNDSKYASSSYMKALTVHTRATTNTEAFQAACVCKQRSLPEHRKLLFLLRSAVYCPLYLEARRFNPCVHVNILEAVSALRTASCPAARLQSRCSPRPARRRSCNTESSPRRVPVSALPCGSVAAPYQGPRTKRLHSLW